jgi:hypothetical protein
VSLNRDRDGSGSSTISSGLTYDLYGNVRTTTDLLGRVTKLCWDGSSEFAAGEPCPGSGVNATSSFAHLIGVREPNGDVTGFLRDTATNAATLSTAYNGAASALLDEFGRPLDVYFTPVGGSQVTLALYDYQDALPRPYVETCRHVDVASSDYLCGRVYSDGFGAAARTVTQVGINAYAGVGVQYDFAGRPVRETLSTACGTDITCASLTASRTTQVLERSYDALGRVK